MLTAVITVFAQLSVMTPIGIPITLQVFAVALCGYLLKPKYAVSVLVVYIIIGAIGLPVFSGFGGGLNVLLGLSGGYIIGFLPLALCCSISFGKGHLKLLLGFLGVLTCHMLGVTWLLISSDNVISLPLILTEAIFTVKDFVLVSLAYLTSLTVNKILIKR